MKVIIQSPTRNIKLSKGFYTKANFQNLPGTNYFCDGTSIIELNESQFCRPGVKLLAKSWKEEVKKLTRICSVTTTDDGFLIGDASGLWIYLVESDENIEIPTNFSASLFGNNQGLSIETPDYDKTVSVWEVIGFKLAMGNKEQGWASLKHEDGLSVSIMAPNVCPHAFLNPSISFFNGKNNIDVISKIRDLKIPIYEEISHFNKEGIVDNIIVSDPGNIGFFIFSD